MAKTSTKKLFTPQLIERLRPEKGRRVEIMDSNCPGLVLRVTENGVRTFGVLYRVVGRGGTGGRGRPLMGPQQRVTLGKYPKIGLREARERARAIIDEASDGRDPKEAAERAAAVRNSTKFEDVVSQFVERHCKPNIKSWQNVDRVLRLHVTPRLKGHPLGEITRADIHRVLDDLVDEGKMGTAREVRKHLSKLYNWAMDRELVTSSPVQGLKRGELTPSEDVGRSLSDDELRAVWRAAGEIGYPFGPYYRLLILTGQRRAEWADARRSEIDATSRWLEIPRARYKGRRDHIVPLSEAAWAIVESLPLWSGENPHLFSSNGGRVPISGFTQGKRRLDEAAREALRAIKGDPGLVLPSYRVHDFRVTCETRLAHLGFNQEVRDAVLGHAKPGLQRTYNKHDYMAEKRRALQAYAEHIMGIVS
jgi:integrase